jgi:hypothetical protein
MFSIVDFGFCCSETSRCDGMGLIELNAGLVVAWPRNEVSAEAVAVREPGCVSGVGGLR